MSLIRYAGFDPYENREGLKLDFDPARAIELKNKNPDWGWKTIGEKLAQEMGYDTPYKADTVAGAVFRYKRKINGANVEKDQTQGL